MTANRKIFILICIIILSLSASVICLNRCSDSGKLNVECVSTEADAIEIGKIICKSVYPQFDYDELSWNCISGENEEWIVFCSEPNSRKLGGGLPEIHIKKENAQVVSIGLQA